MTGTVVPSDKIKDHYNETVKNLKGEYIHYRWGESEIKKRHYKQTELALNHALNKVKRFENVMEIGCGPAVWTPLFSDSATNITLVDISEEMLNVARERLSSHNNINYICGDFVNVNLDEKTKYDLIISVRAYEYMSDKPGMVRKCYELLKPGGSLVIVTKNQGWSDHIKDMEELKKTSVDSIPVGAAMQMDLIDWREMINFYHLADFKNVVTYPVIIGSYNQPFSSKVGLIMCDLLHKYSHKRPIANWHNSLIESYLTIGKKQE